MREAALSYSSTASVRQFSKIAKPVFSVQVDMPDVIPGQSNDTQMRPVSTVSFVPSSK